MAALLTERQFPFLKTRTNPMTQHFPYPWSPLTDLDKATQWCESIDVEKVEALNLQSLLLTVSAVIQEGNRLAMQVWDPDTEKVPEAMCKGFLETASACHDALLVRAAAAHRQSPDCIQPPPSRPLSVATLATRLDDLEGPAGLPQDVVSALLELECVRQMVVAEYFSPLVRAQKGPSPSPATALESLACAVGVVVACVRHKKPWVHVSEG